MSVSKHDLRNYVARYPGYSADHAAVTVREHDGTSTIITTRAPAPVLAALAERDALAGLQVRGATLEDVFLSLTGREYRA